MLPFQRARLPSRRPVRAHRRPAAGDRKARRRALARPPSPDAPGRNRQRQDVLDGPDDQPSPEADARPRPQQDAGRPAVRRVPRVLPRQRGRVLRQLLRLLPARGVPAAVGHVHREGLQPERGDRPAPPRRHPRAVRAPRRDHRRVRVLHLRPGRAGRLRRHGPQAAGRRPLPARRGAAPPRRSPVPAQRHGAHARAVPGPWRHARDRAGQLGDHRPGRVLRRRGGADHGAGPAHRGAAGRAQGAVRVPGHALRDAAGQARPRDGRDRGGDGAPGRADGGRGPGARGGAAPPADDVRPRDAARARLLLGRRELLAPPEPARARQPAVDAARLLPAGLAADRRRVAHDDPAGRRHVQERPDPQGDPRRLRVPAAVRPGQPAADVRGVREARQPDDLRLGDARAVRAREERAHRRAAHPPDRHRRPADHRPAHREPDRRPPGGDPGPGRARASGRSSRR